MRKRSEIEQDINGVSAVSPSTPKTVKEVPQDTTYEEIDISELTDIFSTPVEEKEHDKRQEPKQSIKDRNGIEDIDYEAIDEEPEEVEQFNDEDFNDVSSVFVIILTIAWPMLFYALDKATIKSGVSLDHYQLSTQHQIELQQKAAPVIAKWLVTPPTPTAALFACALTIAGSQMGGAYFQKQFNKSQEIEVEDEQEQEAA